MTLKFTVESWSPEYGTPFDAAPGGADEQAKVDASVELLPADWRPIATGVAPAADVLFVDGVRRVDARIWTDEGDTSRMAICVSYGAGVVRCNGAATVEQTSIARGVFGPAALGNIAFKQVEYRAHPVPEDSMESLINAVQDRMRMLEVDVAAAAGSAELVVIDGPLNGRENIPGAIGYIKSHRVEYLDPPLSHVVSRLAPGERTPVFLTQTTWSRYSWYLRLPGGSGHPWAGIVRCEASESLDLESVIARANLAAATLPRYASEPHKDPRAPQNLYPVGGLERELRRRLGDSLLLHRALLQAAAQS